MKAKIARQFIEETGEQDLWSPISGSAVFMNASGWNKKEYFNTFYKVTTSFPILVIGKDDEGILYLPITVAQEMALEVFSGYWKDTAVMDNKVSTYHELGRELDALYSLLTHSRVASESEKEVLRQARASLDIGWKMNAVGFFATQFDKGLCNEFLNHVGSSISSDRVDEIWEKAVSPVAASFEKRRFMYILSLIAAGENWDSITEKCQYFLAVYDTIPSVEQAKEKFIEQYGLYQDDVKRRQVLDHEEAALNIRKKKHSQWLKTLAPEEQKLVNYIQHIIELRDARKDSISKTITIAYRAARKVFQEAGIYEDLIYYCLFSELEKGSAYCDSIKSLFAKRVNGFAVLICPDGSAEQEYGTYDETKVYLEAYYLRQNESQLNDKDMVAGQVGSPGKAIGTVKVILNLQTEIHKFKKGDILVTGMTRPEYVSLMKKAAAIVTDEGGITCHAAIVSRELGIPCIIGTKVATRIFKDGDRVEVDAEKGTIRKIT